MRDSQCLKNYFDQVWVINLRRREDRLARFWNEISKSQWPFRRPQIFSAIEGNKVGVPKFWQTGGGSYGCMRSHMVLLERAIQDDIGSILVLEDDAVFLDTFGKDVAEFLKKVPNDWQCLMLGGQHVNSKVIPVAPGVVDRAKRRYSAHTLLRPARSRNHASHLSYMDKRRSAL